MIYDKNTMIPCIDWFRGILPVDDVMSLFDNMSSIDSRLDFSNFEKLDLCFLNFRQRYVYRDLPSFIIAFNPVADSYPHCMVADMNCRNKGIMINFSGDVIRFLGHDTLVNLFKLFNNAGVKCTRLDLALDFFDKDNSVVPLFLEGFSNFIAPSHKGCLIVKGGFKRSPSNLKKYVNVYEDGSETFNYTLGNHASEHGMIRLYDKFYETKYGRNRKIADQILNGRSYWYRCEVELHNSRSVDWACQGFNYLIQSNFNLSATYGQCLSEFISVSILDSVATSVLNLFSACSEWEQFIIELQSSIHFVQLVREKFIAKDLSYYWDLASNYSTLISVFRDLQTLDPGKFADIVKSGRNKRRTDPLKKIKYSCVNSFFN